LLLRAFSSGCAALTGVEAISNGVPAFRKPKSRNAATTLALMGLLAVTMFCGIIALAMATDVKMAENPAKDLIRDGVPVGEGFTQDPVIAQVAEAVFGHGSFLFMVLAAATALVLFLAANTAYNGFPLLGSILAQDRYLPRQLHTRGDRLAFSN
nr:amino acid permease [Streptomyces sp. DSM 41633]